MSTLISSQLVFEESNPSLLFLDDTDKLSLLFDENPGDGRSLDLQTLA